MGKSPRIAEVQSHEVLGTTLARLHPSLGAFAADCRVALRSDDAMADRFVRIGRRLTTLLSDPDVVDRAALLPGFDSSKGPENLLLWSDPVTGFGINALVRGQGQASTIHDHGATWTIYGVLSGNDRLRNFVRTDTNGLLPSHASLIRESDTHLAATEYDIVPPWAVHQEMGGPSRVVGLVVRSVASGSFVQNRYSNVGDCSVMQYHGPRQVPFDLIEMRPFAPGEEPWFTTD